MIAQHLLATGANGFIGRAVCQAAKGSGWKVRRALRVSDGSEDCVGVGSIDGTTDWSSAVSGIDAVVHLAGRVHRTGERSHAGYDAYRRVNVDASVKLARAAANAGVKRFVFVSSIGVHGELTTGRPLRETDVPAPESPYARSKLEAEQALRRICRDAGMELVVVRPPIVCGPGAPGNYQRLMRLIARGVPMPFGGVRNLRSTIGVENLAALLVRCAEHPAAAGQTFLAADVPDFATPDLIRTIARGMGVRARLWSVPMPVFRAATTLGFMAGSLNKLIGSLRIDGSAARSMLGYELVRPVEESLILMGAAFKRQFV